MIRERKVHILLAIACLILAPSVAWFVDWTPSTLAMYIALMWLWPYTGQMHERATHMERAGGQ